jgi:hypothetical protein
VSKAKGRLDFDPRSVYDAMGTRIPKKWHDYIANGGGDVFKGIAGRRVVFDETIPQPGPSIRGSYVRPLDSYPLRLK